MLRKKDLAEILSRVRHAAKADGFRNALMQLARKRAEDRGPCYDDLLAHADQQVCVYVEHGVDEVEMLDDDALAVLDGAKDRLRERAELSERRFEADIEVIGMRVEKAVFGCVEQGKRAHVDAVVVVRELEPREHAFDEHALARARLADDADQLIVGGKVHLGDLHSEVVHSVAAARREEYAVKMVVLHSAGIGHGVTSPRGAPFVH